MSRVVGVIGGMGPAATVDFLAKLIQATPAAQDQDHLRVLVDNDPAVPDRLAALAGLGPSPGPHLARMAAGLEHHGAQLLVMPCNTAHAFIDEMLAAVNLPFINMIDCAADSVPAEIDGPVGLLATAGTLESGIYRVALERRGRTLLRPSASDQAVLARAIAAVKGGRSRRAADDVITIADRLIKEGAASLIIGCTELSLGFDSTRLDAPAIDSSSVLALAAARAAFLPGN